MDILIFKCVLDFFDSSNKYTDIPTELCGAPLLCLSFVNARGHHMAHLVGIEVHRGPPKCPLVQSYIMHDTLYGLAINDLGGGGAEENSKMNLFFPHDSLSKFFFPGEGPRKFFFSISSGAPPDH